MSVFAGGSISVCVYVKHTCTFPEGDNTVLLSLQQLAREWTLGNVAVIHTEQTAGAERFQDLANCKQINKHYTRGAGGAGRKRWKELRRAETPASYPAIVKNTFILDLGDTSSFCPWVVCHLYLFSSSFFHLASQILMLAPCRVHSRGKSEDRGHRGGVSEDA